MKDLKKRLLLDCTYVYTSELNTGIQRVVRNVALNSKEVCENLNVDLELIILNDGKIKKIDFIPHNKMAKVTNTFLFFKNIYHKIRKLILFIFPFDFVKHFLFNAKEEFGLRYLVEELIIKPLSLKLPFSKDKRFDLEEIVLKKEDILLLIDSTWHNEIYKSLNLAKEKEVKIFTVIYDIIPITHPEFCDESLSVVFKQWLNNITKYSDGYMAISNSVKEDTIDYFKNKLNYKPDYFDYFILGSNVSKKNINVDIIRNELKDIYQENKKTYIIVSTIEARKNHIQVLRVFEELWENDFDSNLIIIGKIGWKVDDLVKKIVNHKLLNKKLFMFNDIDDNELQYIYNSSDVLIFPSIIEGFGLPIIEGLNNNLKVIASDTPIHREVGKNLVTYFDLNSDKSLKKKISETEDSLITNDKINIPTWKESTTELIEKVLKFNNQIDMDRKIND